MSTRGWGAVLALLVPAWLYGAPAFEPARTYALLVGVVQWQDRDFCRYPTAGRQDRELERSLLGRGVPRDQLVFLEDAQATRARIFSELGTLAARAPEGSTLLLYFTGHGDFIDGHPYYFPFDADGNDLAARGVAPDAVADTVTRLFHGRRVLVFGDFCHSQMLNRIAERLAGVGLEAAALASAHLTSDSTPEWTFTEALAAILRGTPAADANRDRIVSWNEAVNSIADQMYYRADQVRGEPFLGHLPVDFALATVPAGAKVATWGALREGEYVEFRVPSGWAPAQIAKIDGVDCALDPPGEQPVTRPCAELRLPVILPRHVGQSLDAVYNGKHNPVTVLGVFRNFLYVRFTGARPYDEWIDAADTVVRKAETRR